MNLEKFASNLCIILPSSFLFAYLFVIPEIQSSRYWNAGTTPTPPQTMKRSLFSPASNNKCNDYHYTLDTMNVAVPARGANYYTCCDWIDEDVPIRKEHDKVFALCGAWPFYNEIVLLP